MKYAVVLLALILVVSTTAKPADNKRFSWNIEACEKVAAKARQESKVCEDYVCKEYSYGLAVSGVNCKNDGQHV